MDTNNRYNNSKIYKITDIAYTECYIGSTVQTLATRMAQHRRDYKQYKNGNALYVSSYALFDKYGIENCKIELLEDYACDSKDQLAKREGHYIKLEDCINKYVAGRTIKEWYDDHPDYKREVNKEKKQAIDKAYYEANKQKCQDKAKAYYDNNKETCQAKGKARYEANKERRKVSDKLYREANKDKIQGRAKAFFSQKVVCPCCGKTLTKRSMYDHKNRCTLEQSKI